MSRHPNVLHREQRAMNRARTIGRRHRLESTVEDGRDLDRPDPPARRRCLLMAADRTSVSGWRQVTECQSHEDAITLADLANTNCIVRDVRTGKIVYDNRKPVR